MPFARQHGTVPIASENLGYIRGCGSNLTSSVRIALVASRQFLHADDMIIPAREERRPSWGTHRLGMKIVEL